MKRLILVIEEFEILRAQLDEMLTDAGFRVRLAKTFREGMSEAQHQQFQAVLLDVTSVPDGSDDFLQVLQRQTPVLLTATKVQRERAENLIQNGFIDCIHKPFTKTEVLGKLSGAIQGNEELASAARKDSDVLPETASPTRTNQTFGDGSTATAILPPEDVGGFRAGRPDIARLHLTIERASEARAAYLRCLQQQERNHRIFCDEQYRVLEQARAEFETQLNEYIDSRLKLASAADKEPLQNDSVVEDFSALTNGIWSSEHPGSAFQDVSKGIDLEREISRYEIDLIKRALELTGGHQSRAARLLRMNPTTLNSKIKKYGILV